MFKLREDDISTDIIVESVIGECALVVAFFWYYSSINSTQTVILAQKYLNVNVRAQEEIESPYIN